MAKTSFTSYGDKATCDRPYSYRNRRWNRPTTKYVKNVNHVKKNVKYTNNTAWRVEKKFKKDKGRNWDGHYGCKCSKYDRRMTNRSHRTWVKQQIKNENWDIFSYKERKKWMFRWW